MSGNVKGNLDFWTCNVLRFHLFKF